jgi:SAM-dependent methyltransferase
MNALSVILEAFAPVSGRSVLDIGCGPGALAKSLAAHGALVTGIDPNAAMVTAAATAVPDGHFDVGSAERLRFADASFGGAVFLNSLHHLSDVRTALREAARVVETDARIVVVEPLTEGSFFDALRPVEDETEVRHASQAALEALIASAEFRCVRDVVFDRVETFESLAHFLDRVLAVDPARAEAIRNDAPSIKLAFLAAAARDPKGAFVLVQPLRACVLENQALADPERQSKSARSACR